MPYPKSRRVLGDGLVQVFTNKEVRGITAYNSDVVDARAYLKRTVQLISTLDQAVTATVQGSRNADFDNPANLGDAIGVAATGSAFAEREHYFPYLRVQVQGDVTATTGSLNGFVMLKF